MPARENYLLILVIIRLKLTTVTSRSTINKIVLVKKRARNTLVKIRSSARLNVISFTVKVIKHNG